MDDPATVGAFVASALAIAGEAVLKGTVGEAVKDAYRALKERLSHSTSTNDGAPDSVAGSADQIAVLANTVEEFSTEDRHAVFELAQHLVHELKGHPITIGLDVSDLEALAVKLGDIDLKPGGIAARFSKVNLKGEFRTGNIRVGSAPESPTASKNDPSTTAIGVQFTGPGNQIFIAMQEGGARSPANLVPLTPDQLETLPVHPGLRIQRISYGTPPQRVDIPDKHLFFLGKNARLPRGKNKAYQLTDLIPTTKDDLERKFLGKQVFFPREFTVNVGKPASYLRSPVRLFICTDIPYPTDIANIDDAPSFNERLLFGLPCLAAFVTEIGDLRPRDACTVGNGLGCVGIVVAVAYSDDGPQIRSNYCLVIRQGIRYPDDKFLSARTSRPIVRITNDSGRADDYVSARFAFQSRQEGGLGSAIFLTDYNGERMCNVTDGDRNCTNTFENERGEEIVRWTDQGEILFLSNYRGTGRLEQVTRLDPFGD